MKVCVLLAAAGGLPDCREILNLHDRATNSCRLGSMWLQAAAIELIVR